MSVIGMITALESVSTMPVALTIVSRSAKVLGKNLESSVGFWTDSNRSLRFATP